MTMQSAVRRRRAVAAAGAVSAGLLVLSACDKPTPVSTITVGRNSVHTEATCYNDGDAVKTAELAKCLKASTSISVDPTTAGRS
jgi:poly(3-hydroxybutyrate) depolymerase